MYRTGSSLVCEKIQRKLKSFDIHHHPVTREVYQRQIQLFNEKCKEARCPRCWLRSFDCYCSELNPKLTRYSQRLENIQRRVHVMIYYHYLEVGRSANTAHLFDLIYSKACDSLVFGNSEKEISLFERMKRDNELGNSSFCVLYPSTAAVSLNEWISKKDPSKPVTMIALDGTYSQALRQYKHLKKATAYFNIPLEVVKLDIGPNGCKSAIEGIMQQPQKEKICTYQAILMALQQVGMEDDLYAELRNELDLWLQYILNRSIRKGKTKVRKPRGLIDDIDSLLSSESEDDLIQSRPIPKPIPEQFTKSDEIIQSLHNSATESNQHGSEQTIQMKKESLSVDIIPTKKFGVFSVK